MQSFAEVTIPNVLLNVLFSSPITNENKTKEDIVFIFSPTVVVWLGVFCIEDMT